MTATVEGSRPLLVEVQALVAPTYLASPRRSVTGMDTNRVHMVLAVLEKRARVPISNQDVFINVAGGIRIDEPGADLAMALAVASHVRERPLDKSLVAVGEIGLAGEVRAVPQIEKRVREAARLGFTTIMISARNRAAIKLKDIPKCKVVGVETVHQAIASALGEA